MKSVPNSGHICVVIHFLTKDLQDVIFIKFWSHKSQFDWSNTLVNLDVAIKTRIRHFVDIIYVSPRPLGRTHINPFLCLHVI